MKHVPRFLPSNLSLKCLGTCIRRVHGRPAARDVQGLAIRVNLKNPCKYNMLCHDPRNLYAFKNEGGRRGFCRFKCGIHLMSSLKRKGPMPLPPTDSNLSECLYVHCIKFFQKLSS